MLRIRRIFDLALPIDRQALGQVEEILRARFPGIDDGSVAALGRRLRDPFPGRLRPVIFVAEDHRRVLGFASVLHAPDLAFMFLEYIATASAPQEVSRGGVGAALYERIRQEARDVGCRALFLEVPNAAAMAPESAEARQCDARLRFYERLGVFPIVGTEYELPVREGGSPGPHLLYDDLGSGVPLPRELARRAVRAILERHYRELCPAAYVDRVVASFRDDPVRLGSPPRPAAAAEGAASPARPDAGEIALVVADRHEIHHVRERGYVEAPARVGAILVALEGTGLFQRRTARRYAVRHLEAVHAPELVRYVRRACREMAPNKALYPYVFPLRNRRRLPAERSVLAGYFCMDTFTPITRNAYAAAKAAAECALTAADAVLAGSAVAYALVRPPGHHAERHVFGGFCYFNNAAVAAQHLSGHGRVAILDVDYHHGNGQQDVFWERADVFTVSLHGHPRFAYPYFSGFSDERGAGDGEGANLNLPLPERQDGAQYRRALARALDAVAKFAPRFLVVALGLDPAKGDPTGTWSLRAEDFRRNGAMIGALGLPTLVVQEGGYRTRTLGANAVAFFQGLSTSPPLAAAR